MSSLKEVRDLLESLETDDVGQKRYLMYRAFDLILDEVHGNGEIDPEKRIEQLREGHGYLYKLAQEFLTSSSTLEKQRKLEKMFEHLDS